METEQVKYRILHGNMWQTMFSLSIPSIVGFLLFGLNILLDGFFVGYFIGGTALAGITLAYPLTQFLAGFANLIGVGTANILSVHIGKNDTRLVSEQLGNMLVVSLFLSLPLMLLGFFGAPALMDLMGVTGPSYVYGLEYFRVIALGSLFLNLATGLNFLIRGEGNMKEAMVLFGLAVVFNVILNPIFISVLDWGIAGSAWATNVAMFLSVVIHYVYIYTNRKGFYSFRNFSVNLKALSHILSSGLPSFLLNLLTLFQQYLCIQLINQMGGEGEVAFFGMVYRIVLFAFLPAIGMARAFQPVIGITFGANQPEKMKEAFRVFNMAGLTMIGVIFLPSMLFATNIIQFSLPGFAIRSEQINNFYLFMWTLPLLPFLLFSMTFLQAVGKSIQVVAMVLLRQIILFLPGIYLLSDYFKVRGVYTAFLLIDVLVALGACVLIHAYFKNISVLKQEVAITY